MVPDAVEGEAAAVDWLTSLPSAGGPGRLDEEEGDGNERLAPLLDLAMISSHSPWRKASPCATTSSTIDALASACPAAMP